MKLTAGPSDQPQRFVSPQKCLSSYQRAFVNKWAVTNFTDWKESYNVRHPEEKCPDDMLLSDDPRELSFWLQKYVLETRKKDGSKYPPKTIHLLLCGQHRYIKEVTDESLNIFDKEHSHFKKLFNTCDT